METTTFYTLVVKINNADGSEDWYLSTRDLEDPGKEIVIISPLSDSPLSGLMSLIDRHVAVTHSGIESVGKLWAYSKDDEFSIEYNGKTIWASATVTMVGDAHVTAPMG